MEIEAPASVVWHELTDLPNYNDWNPHCVRIESTLRAATRTPRPRRMPAPASTCGTPYCAGNEAACAMLVDCRIGGQTLRVETLDTMAFDREGRIVSRRAHVGPLNFHPQAG